jgi:hypothetical protein
MYTAIIEKDMKHVRKREWLALCNLNMWERVLRTAYKVQSDRGHHCGQAISGTAARTALVYSEYVAAYIWGIVQHSTSTRWGSLCTVGQQRTEIRLHNLSYSNFSDLLHSLKDLVKKPYGSIPVSALFQYYSKYGLRSIQYMYCI